MKIGVLALQGAVREHLSTLSSIGVDGVPVRLPGDLDHVAGLIIPGGESTTMRKLIDRWGLRGPIMELAATGAPIFGTCAGMIVLARRVEGGDPLFAVMDIGVQRNAYGRQVDSFEDQVDVEGIDHAVRGVFIRAPKITDVGADVRILARHEGDPVVLEQGNLLVSSFHPELIGETGLHRYLLSKM